MYSTIVISFLIIISTFNFITDGSIKHDRFLFNEQTFQEFNDNYPPMTPVKPKGPSSGEASVEYEYISNTTDPDGDDIYFLFDWGDGTNSSWIGPFASGVETNAPHIWQEKGFYKVKVKAKDVYGSESSWSESLDVEIFGPYLTFGDIKGGLGLNVKIKNIGNRAATDIKLNIEAEGGLKIFLPK
ncbi:MAG: PKD domain-containing protein, partial [Thermoplasmatales archaeon]